MQLLCKQD